jgi:glutaconate CoA-transferase subunit A
MIPGIIVHAVCHVPYACHPSYAQGYYDRDNEFYLKWDEISSSEEAVKGWLEEWVYGVKDRNEYWEKLGEGAHERLRVKPRMSEAINYGEY